MQHIFVNDPFLCGKSRSDAQEILQTVAPSSVKKRVSPTRAAFIVNRGFVTGRA